MEDYLDEFKKDPVILFNELDDDQIYALTLPLSLIFLELPFDSLLNLISTRKILRDVLIEAWPKVMYSILKADSILMGIFEKDDPIKFDEFGPYYREFIKNKSAEEIFNTFKKEYNNNLNTFLKKQFENPHSNELLILVIP